MLGYVFVVLKLGFAAVWRRIVRWIGGRLMYLYRTKLLWRRDCAVGKVCASERWKGWCFMRDVLVDESRDILVDC